MANGSNYISGNETVFKYNSPGGECLSVTLFKVSNEAGLYVFDGCPGTPGATLLASDSAYWMFTPTYGLPQSIDAEFVSPHAGTYYIVVSNPYPYSGNDTDFDLYISSNTASDEGARCETPYNVDSLNYHRSNVSTSCKEVDYAGSNTCIGIGDRGNDVVFKITPDKDACSRIVASKISTKLAFYLMDGCPDDTNASCIQSAFCDIYGCDSVSIEHTFEKGKTYYLVASGGYGITAATFDLDIETYETAADTCIQCNQDLCVACKNIGFETATFIGWTGYEGIFTNPKQTSVINPGTINQSNTRHTVMSAGSYDPIVGPDLPVTSPLGGNYGVRLGNGINGAQAEVLSYTYVVDSNTNMFNYYYAVVLEDGLHLAADQPFFETNVFVDGSEVITCGYYQVSAAANVPGFKPIPGRPFSSYKPWALASIPLINYMGRTVTIEFTTKDCSQGGHFGYGYVDAFCGKSEILQADKEGRPITIDGNTGFLCKDSTITLTAPDGYAKYKWSNGDTTQSIKITSAGDYTVIITSVTGCSAQIKTSIKDAPDPIAGFTFEQPCSAIQVGFTDKSANKPGDTHGIISYFWDFGDGTTSTNKDEAHAFPGPGTYTVKHKVRSGANCENWYSETITVKPPVVIPPINAKDTIIICERDSIVLTSDDIGASSQNWSGPKGFSSTLRNVTIPDADTLRTGNYIITAKVGACDNAKDTTYVKVVGYPKFKLSNDTNVCYSYSGITLKAQGGETYDWSPGYKLDKMTGPSVKTTTDTTIEYAVLISNTICPDSVMTVKVTVDDFQEALVADHYLSSCIGDTLIAHATANPSAFITWTGPGGATQKDSLQIKNTNLGHNGYYKVRSYLGPNNYCIFGTDSVQIRIHPTPVPAMAPVSTTICYNYGATVTASGAAQYEWKLASNVLSTAAPLTVANLKQTTTYDLNVYSDSGCFADTTYTIQVKKDFKVDLGPDRIACDGDTLQLSLFNADFIQKNAGFVWTGGTTDTTLIITQTGDYVVVVTENGCTKSDTVHVTFQQPSAFSIGQDQILCSTDSFLIDLSGISGTVTWTDGFPAKKRYITNPGGVFGVVAVVGTCTLSDSITINFQQRHPVWLGKDSVFCKGGSYTLNSQYPSWNNTWQDGTASSTQNNFTVSAPGIHNVILTVDSGVCSNSDTVKVTVQSPPPFDLGPDQTVCENIVVTLTAIVPGATTFNWNTGSNTDTIHAAKPGVYDVIVSDGICTVKDSLKVNHDLIPVFTLGVDQVHCQGQSTTIGTPILADQYSWNSGQNVANITVTTSGNYILTIDKGQCQFKDTVKITFNAPPVINLGAPFERCDRVDTVLRATTPNSSYKWSDNSTADTLRVTQAGTYSVVVTQGPCTGTNSIKIDVQPMHTVKLEEDRVSCLGATEVLKSTTSSSSPTYLWSTGETTKDITVDSTSNYWLRVTDDVCVKSDSMLMTFVSPPTVNLGNDSLMCDGEAITLNATFTGAKYIWSTNDTTPTITINKTGVYHVQDVIGPCHDEDTITLTFKVPPVVELIADQEICSGELLTITGNVTKGLNYEWNTGSKAREISVGLSGTYILTVTDLPCVRTDTFKLVVHPLPEIKLQDTLICPNDSAYIDAYYPGASFQWSSGEISNALWAFPGELKEVHLTSAEGCTWDAIVHVYEDKDCPEEIYVPNAFTPNADGVNDVFRVVTGNTILHEVKIFNRWGEMIYMYTDPKGGWDGRYRGDICESTTYDVLITYTNIYKVKKMISSHVTLLK